jgi:pSer/pThr/pTyr-binding forkhead associated (FHA) protein
MSLRAVPPRVAAPTPTPDVAAAQGLIPNLPQMPSPMPQFGTAPQGGLAASAQPQQISTLRSDQVSPVATDPPCPRCSEKNPEGSRFCHSCGFALLAATQAKIQPPASTAPISVVCSRCRGVADPGADFCKFCGARLASEPASVPRQQPAQQAAPAPVPRPSPAPELSLPQPQYDPAAPPQGPTRPLHGIGDVTVRARLVRIAKDGSEGAQHPITADLTDVGRSEGAIVLPDDPYLSPRHARLTLRAANSANGDANAASSLILADLGSVNGVFVRLRGPHTLTHGDLLLVGQQVLRFEAVTELEGARGPAMQHGVLLFGSPAPMSRARLIQRTVEGLARDVLFIVRDEFTLGREVGDRTYPEDVFMSRRHATIKREGSSFVLHDLGSSNGTFVQIHGEYALRDGDQFRIGHHLFRVDVPAPGTA